MVIHSRRLKNKFSIELNDCNENENDGIRITLRRFQFYIESVSGQIEKNNKAISDEISKEDADVAFSMSNQFDVDINLNYFLDNILKSNLIGIYSYFEHTLKRICKICKTELQTAKTLESFKEGALINKRNSFLIDQVIPLLSKEKGHFDKILIWNKLRNDIVHEGSILKNFDPQSFKHASLVVSDNSFQFTNSDIILEFLSDIETYLVKIIALINRKYDLIEYA